MKRLIVSWILVATAVGSAAQELPPTPSFSTGLDFIDSGQYAAIPLSAPRFAGPLPARVDLAPFAPTGDQGPQGSCVGWAVAYALKTFQENRERNWGVTAPDRQFSPSFVYNQIKSTEDCKGGTTFPDALNLVTRDGVATLAEFPYDPSRCDQVPSALTKQRAQPFRIASWRRVNTMDETEVKTHLADGYPILVGMPVDSAFMSLREDSVYQGLTGPSLGGHAMVVTAYDNDRGAFRLQNSWGTGWGESGRGWISYTAFRKTVREGYVVHDIIATPAQVTSSVPSMEFETTILAEVPAGSRSVRRTTADHHCSSNCAGEPTRTNYGLELIADDGATLRNPQLRCVSGPCHGWNSVLSVRLESDGRRAVASWDVWTSPTTWELVADQVKVSEVSRFSRRVELGQKFEITGETGAPSPKISGKLSSGETFAFIAGRPTYNRYITFIAVEVRGPETAYHYESRAP